MFCMITKCLPIVALCLFIIQHGFNFQFKYIYSRRIVTGLIFSMIGDACLVYDKEHFVHGLLAFAVAHVLYMSAFGIRPFNFRLGLALLFAAIPTSAFTVPFISSYILRFLVPVYSLLVVAMLWRATSRLQLFNKNIDWTWTRLCCSLGALLFVISDSVISVDLFIMKVPYYHPIVMVTYYAAQLGIALSVVEINHLSSRDREVNKMVIQHGDLVNGVRRVYNYLKSAYFDDNIQLIQLDDQKAQ